MELYNAQLTKRERRLFGFASIVEYEKWLHRRSVLWASSASVVVVGVLIWLVVGVLKPWQQPPDVFAFAWCGALAIAAGTGACVMCIFSIAATVGSLTPTRTIDFQSLRARQTLRVVTTDNSPLLAMVVSSLGAPRLPLLLQHATWLDAVRDIFFGEMAGELQRIDDEFALQARRRSGDRVQQIVDQLPIVGGTKRPKIGAEEVVQIERFRREISALVYECGDIESAKRFEHALKGKCSSLYLDCAILLNRHATSLRHDAADCLDEVGKIFEAVRT